MRSLALFCELVMLLPITVVQPFVGVLLWSWVSFMNPHRLVYGGIALEIPWALSIFVATMIGCVVAREPKRFPCNAVTVSIILFLVMISISSCFAMAPWNDVYQKWDLTFKSFLFLLVTASLLTTQERIHALVWVMVVSLAFFGIKGGAFTIIGGGTNKVFGPPNSMINDNNHLATALLVCLPLMNYLRLHSRHRIIRIGFVATMVLTLFAVVGSYSRGAFLTIGAMSFFLWLKTPNKLLSGTVILALIAATMAFMPEIWIERMQSIQNYQHDGSAMGRLNIWYASWVMAESRLFGSGFFGPYTQSVVDHFVSNVDARAVHSIWFEVIGEHGFITFGVWLSIIVAGFICARRIVQQAKDIPDLQWCVSLAKMTQVSTAAYCVGGSFLSLCYWDYYFTIVVMVSAVYEHVKVEVANRTRQEQGSAKPLSSWQLVMSGVR
jgi:probable O-glycosylation ligase (exosortase A-associated)